MATNFIYIHLDTTAPSNPTVKINGGAVFTTNPLVDLAINVGDADKTGHQMLIWGDIDENHDTNIKSTEQDSQWVSYSDSKQVKLSSGDGNKTINIRVRDDVHNTSSIATSSISMDTSLPTVTVTQPDVDKISKVAGKDTFSFTFSCDTDFLEYKVKLVSATGATENTGTTIPNTGGSTNTSGKVGDYMSGQVIATTIKGQDLVNAGASSDGEKIVKVFVQDYKGFWSV